MKLQALTREEFADKCWQRCTSYQFSANQHLSPLVLAEMPKAMMAFPIAFVHQAQGYVPVALMSLLPGVNWLVHPDGHWLASYTPAVLRSHPFHMAHTDDAIPVLCFDVDSGLLHELGAGDSGAEAFFDQDGQPSATVGSIMQFLRGLVAQRQVTERACGLLAAYGLIQPWSIKVATPQGEKTLDGLSKVDEARLSQLSGSELQELVRAGSIGLAYCQLLSMQHLPMLGRLADQQAQWRQTAAVQQPLVAADLGLPSTPSGELDLEFLNRGGTLSFGA